MNTRIAFWGTPELTNTYLEKLSQAGMKPVVVITNPDRPKGRGQELTSPPAKVWAENNGIQVLQPEKLDEDFFALFSDLQIDISIVVAYGKIMPKNIIDQPKHGTLNVHYSLLPHLRGASPIESAILLGDTETGCAIQVMRPALDSGPIIAEIKTEVGSDETAPELRTKLTDLGAQLLVDTLPAYLAGEITPKEQDASLATKCGKISKEDGLLDIHADGVQNYRKYRAYKEWPRTYFIQDAKRVIITSAHLENDSFVIDKVLPEGKKEVSYKDFLNSQHQ
jgi:methionyl-tRNA formyltransferase